MPSAAIFRLLLTADSADEANHFVSILRSANYTVDAKLATQEHELQPLLAQQWDLLLTLDNHSLLPPARVRQNLLRAENDAPFIIISELADQASLLEGLRLGAETVVARDHDQQLLLAVERCQQSVAVRRELSHQRRQLQLLQRQQRSLLNSWPTPLLVVVEGIIRLCNGAAARMLQSEPSALLDLPILDSLDTRSRQLLRGHLLGEPTAPSSGPELLTFIDANGVASTRRVALTHLLFDGHNALQIAVEARVRRDPGSSAQRRPDLTPQPQQALAAVERGLQRCADDGRSGAFMQIAISHYSALANQLGSHRSAELVERLLALCSSHLAEAAELVLSAPGCVLLTLIDGDVDYTLARARTLYTLCHDELADYNPEPALAINIGVTLLNSAVTSAEQALSDSVHALELSGEQQQAVLYPPRSDSPTAAAAVDDLIDEQSLRVCYQPLAALCGRQRQLFLAETIAGSEQSPLRERLDQAHSSEQRQRLDHWVTLSALRELSAVATDASAVALLLPVSAVSIIDARFVPWLTTQLRNHPVPEQALTLVLRESDVIRYLDRIPSCVEQLAGLGVNVAISHFGVALNPLDTLNSVQPSLLLLDRQVSGALDDPSTESSRQLVAALLDLNQQVAVIGVEAAAALPSLWRAGIHFIAGSYVGAAQESLRG